MIRSGKPGSGGLFLPWVCISPVFTCAPFVAYLAATHRTTRHHAKIFSHRRYQLMAIMSSASGGRDRPQRRRWSQLRFVKPVRWLPLRRTHFRWHYHARLPGIQRMIFVSLTSELRHLPSSFLVFAGLLIVWCCSPSLAISSPGFSSLCSVLPAGLRNRVERMAESFRRPGSLKSAAISPKSSSPASVPGSLKPACTSCLPSDSAPRYANHDWRSHPAHHGRRKSEYTHSARRVHRAVRVRGSNWCSTAHSMSREPGPCLRDPGTRRALSSRSPFTV